MGVSILSATRSAKLKRIVTCVEAEDHDWCEEAFDLTSTPGYNNDGSTGPELVDNGIELGFACRDYDRQAKVFFAYGKDRCYYQFGKDEDDALRRLNEKCARTANDNGLKWSPPR